jgi:chitinase
MPNGDKPYFVEAAYPAWRIHVYPSEAIPLEYVQQISHVFVLPGENGALTIPDGFLLPQLVERVHTARKTIVVGVGGASSHDEFAPMVADPADRVTFVQNLTDFVVEQGYDGVMIDWEFPQTPTECDNLNALMGELRASLDATGQDLQLNIAVSSGEWFGQWIDTDSITPLVDYYLLMTFSFHGVWSTQSGHNAPLYSPLPELDSSGSVDETVHYWIEARGVPESKIVVGLPTYGVSFDSEGLYRPFSTSNQACYSEIQPLVNNGYTRQWDSTSQVPYLIQDDGPILWSCDDAESIGLKCDYVFDHNLAGVMIWEVTGDLIDGQQELLRAIADKLIPPPRIYLSAAPDNVTICAGQVATYTLSVTATGSITGLAALTLHNQPMGISATFDPNPVELPATSRLTIANTTGLTPGTYAMTVIGTQGTLLLSDSVSISLTIISPHVYLPLVVRNESTR